MNSTKTKPKIITFGCRLNSYESEIILDNAEQAGLSDCLIVNSCAVTGEAVRQTRQAIRKAKRANPKQKIIVTGCAAQTEPASFANMGEVDLVIGNRDKLEQKTYQNLTFGTDLNDKIKINDIMSVKETANHLISSMDGRARAFVQVQNGCDHRCTFCIIPFGRGPSRSTPVGHVVEQIKKLVDNGYNEIVLTGVDITSYGTDLPGNLEQRNFGLGKLVQEILVHVPDLPRLRISSIDSIEMDSALFDAMSSEKRLMAHLHLSLQSGDNMILKRMKRRHTYDDIISLTTKLRKVRPEIVFGADIIAGFPTETDEMFENSMKIVAEADITYLHVFPYSKREGTPAAKIPNQIPKNIAKQRAAKLRELGNQQFEKLCASRVGRQENVLVEKVDLGRTEQFVPVNFTGAKQGEIVKVQISNFNAKGLVGTLVRSTK